MRTGPGRGVRGLAAGMSGTHDYYVEIEIHCLAGG